MLKQQSYPSSADPDVLHRTHNAPSDFQGIFSEKYWQRQSKYGVIQKKVVHRAFENHVDCLEQKELLQSNTRTKDYLCANFQDIW